ncbi:MAG TPA: dephospho-CoA kinase [Clostridiales bacterium]|nr:dephospho-CoA kinase [Clostridiales bacterium]
MKIIGVTGGIGSGKSSVARILKDLGAAVIDADVLAKSVTSAGGKAFDELVGYFGEEIVGDDGEIDRKKLAHAAFSDEEKLKMLNAITHKHIAEKIYDTVEVLKNTGKWDTIVIDAPIPIEKGFIDLADEIWVVVADRETRIRRAMERSGYTYDEVAARIDSQMSEDEYLELADEVIRNGDSIEELEQTVVRLFLSKKQKWQQ